MDPRPQKAVELASDSTKVLITLAAAILALTITLATDVAQYIELLAAAWTAYLVSLIAGVWKLTGLTGELERAARNDSQPSLRAGAVLLPSRIQTAAFAVGPLCSSSTGSFLAASRPAGKFARRDWRNRTLGARATAGRSMSSNRQRTSCVPVIDGQFAASDPSPTLRHPIVS